MKVRRCRRCRIGIGHRNGVAVYCWGCARQVRVDRERGYRANRRAAAKVGA